MSETPLQISGRVTIVGSLGWALLAPASPTSLLSGPILLATILQLGQGKPRTSGGAAVSVGHWRWAWSLQPGMHLAFPSAVRILTAVKLIFSF